jgi:hypothetical protein
MKPETEKWILLPVTKPNYYMIKCTLILFFYQVLLFYLKPEFSLFLYPGKIEGKEPGNPEFGRKISKV